MRKTTAKVFGFIAVLVAVFIAWQLFFNNGGILNYGYNKIANGVNSQWAKVAGDGQKLLPLWATDGSDEGDGGHKAATNGHGFTMETSTGNTGGSGSGSTTPD